MSLYPSPWSLDRLLGLRYRVTSGHEVARVCQPRESCFIVGEEPPITIRAKGRYCVYVLVKKGKPTLQAISVLEKKLLGRRHGRAVFFGLKDTDATTLQYVCAPCQPGSSQGREGPIRLGEGAWARLVGYTDHCRSTPPEGNRFWIILEPLREVDDVLARLAELGSKLLPNYYGYQRFGTRRPNTHLLGLSLIKRDYATYLGELLGSPYPDESTDNQLCRLRAWRGCESGLYESMLSARAESVNDFVTKLPYKIVSLYVSALQAYIFNLYLSKRIELGYRLSERIKGERGNSTPLAPVPGLGYRIGVSGEARQILRDVLESIGLSEEDIRRPVPRIKRVKPFWRPIAFRIDSIRAKKIGDRVVVFFRLGYGMYATTVLRELVKIPDGL